MVGQSIAEDRDSHYFRLVQSFDDKPKRRLRDISLFINVSIGSLETVDQEPRAVSIPSSPTARFTVRQGQYLAFIHAYTKVNGRPPAQAELRRFFVVTAPSVHQMILALERRGLLCRFQGGARGRQPRPFTKVRPPARAAPTSYATSALRTDG